MKKLILISILLVSLVFIAGCSKCGNGVCDEGENKCSCPQDCGECSGSAGKCLEYYCDEEKQCGTRLMDNCCGNAIVEEKETCSNCPEDIKCQNNTLCCLGECRNPICLQDSNCEKKQFFDVQCENSNTCDSKCIDIPWSPTKTTETYFGQYTAWLFHDYNLMYDLLADSVKPKSPDYLKVDIENHKLAFTIGGLSCSYRGVENEKISGNTATVDLSYKTKVSFGFQEIKTETITLVKEEGRWKLKRIYLC